MATSYQQDDSLDSAAEFTDNVESRETLGKVFEVLFLLGLLIGLFILALLLFDIFKDGLGRFLTPGFLTETPSRFPDQGGIRPAIISSVLLGTVVILVT